MGSVDPLMLGACVVAVTWALMSTSLESAVSSGTLCLLVQDG